MCLGHQVPGSNMRHVHGLERLLGGRLVFECLVARWRFKLHGVRHPNADMHEACRPVGRYGRVIPMLTCSRPWPAGGSFCFPFQITFL